MSKDTLVSTAMKDYLSRPGVTETTMFGSPGLKIDGKYFALLVKGKLVVKLTKDRVQQLVENGTGDYFDPGHGRKMKEWLEFIPKSAKTCTDFMDEAITVVSAIASKEKSKFATKKVKASA